MTVAMLIALEQHQTNHQAACLPPKKSEDLKEPSLPSGVRLKSGENETSTIVITLSKTEKRSKAIKKHKKDKRKDKRKKKRKKQKRRATSLDDDTEVAVTQSTVLGESEGASSVCSEEVQLSQDKIEMLV